MLRLRRPTYRLPPYPFPLLSALSAVQAHGRRCFQGRCSRLFLYVLLQKGKIKDRVFHSDLCPRGHKIRRQFLYYFYITINLSAFDSCFLFAVILECVIPQFLIELAVPHLFKAYAHLIQALLCYLCRRFNVIVKVYCLDIIVCYRLFCIRRRCAKSGNYHVVFLLDFVFDFSPQYRQGTADISSLH